MPTAEFDLIRDPGRAAALLDPLRLRILESLGDGDSASGLSRRLGLPRQKLNYHLRELEKAELVEMVEERRRGNCMERVLRATARAYVITPEVLGALGADPSQFADRFSAGYLIAVAARTIRELAELRQGAEKAGKRLATFTLDTEVRFASAEQRHAFAEELGDAVARLAAKFHDEHAPGGRRFRVTVGSHPLPKTAHRSEGAEDERKKSRHVH